MCHFTEFHFVPAQLQLDQGRHMLLTYLYLQGLITTEILKVFTNLSTFISKYQ